MSSPIPSVKDNSHFSDEDAAFTDDSFHADFIGSCKVNNSCPKESMCCSDKTAFVGCCYPNISTGEKDASESPTPTSLCLPISSRIAVLADEDIRREIKDGNIILHDPDNDCTGNIQNCSVDITLGEYYYRNTSKMSYFDPTNSAHVHQYWGEVQKADLVDLTLLVEDSTQASKTAKPGIMLAPGETILAHTREFVGGRKNITTMVKARSSMGRSNVTICRDAGWGDIGYYNRWCLEISNSSTCPVLLTVGQRIGQIVFFYTGIPRAVYAGKYQQQSELDDLVKNWDPAMLLPRLYLDK